jgi:hypothetical protein
MVIMNIITNARSVIKNVLPAILNKLIAFLAIKLYVLAAKITQIEFWIVMVNAYVKIDFTRILMIWIVPSVVHFAKLVRIVLIVVLAVSMNKIDF